ncbi:MAG: hypothetical protein Q7V58_06915 [Actinomycetota bacterium]|nr:hypothetical protein [Actinomycetota bacterium]
MDVLTSVENRVRDGVRLRGIDPMREPDLTQHAFSAVAGFGPLQKYLDDPEIEELWINERLTDA